VTDSSYWQVLGFANGDAEFRAQMIGYIRSHFAQILGDDVRLLDLPNGLDLIKEKYGI
jgi:hypothetical protein